MNTELNSLPEPLAIYAQKLVDNGFTVLLPQTEKPTWVHFSKDNQLGYVNHEKHRGFSFGTEHKPSTDWGTGISTYREVVEPTIEMAERTMNRPLPKASARKRPPVKYSGIDEFVSKNYFKPLVITAQQTAQ